MSALGGAKLSYGWRIFLGTSSEFLHPLWVNTYASINTSELFPIINHATTLTTDHCRRPAVAKCSGEEVPLKRTQPAHEFELPQSDYFLEC